jgi:hypothetical protein
MAEVDDDGVDDDDDNNDDNNDDDDDDDDDGLDDDEVEVAAERAGRGDRGRDDSATLAEGTGDEAVR